MPPIWPSTQRTPPPKPPLSEAVSNPEIYGTPDVHESDLNIPLRKKTKYIDDTTQSLNEMFGNVLEMFKDLKASQNGQFSKLGDEIGALRSQNEELISANAEIKLTLASITEEQTQLKSRVECLENSDKMSQEYASELEEQLEQVQRKIKETSVEINNLTTENYADMMTVIEKIYKTVKLDFDSRDIKEAYRIPTRSNRPRSIIIEFTSSQKKILLLRAYKDFNKNQNNDKLNTGAIGVAGEKLNVYLSEVLTKKGRRLHYLAREFIKKYNWKFCWTKSGKIFIREEEGKAAIEIKNAEQIVTLEDSIKSHAR